MNRSDLIQQFKERTGVAAGEADWIVRQFFDLLTEGLKRDGRVELRGFGVFRLSERQQADFRNPKDGRIYPGKLIKTIKFYPSNSLDSEKEGR